MRHMSVQCAALTEESSWKPPRMTSRNDPCPCGSGKKYKKCCLEVQAGLTANSLLLTLSGLETGITAYAQSHYGEQVMAAGWSDFSRWGKGALARAEQAYRPAFNAWVMYSWLPDHAPEADIQLDVEPSDQAIAADFMGDEQQQLTPVERALVQAAVRSPYSFYVVESKANSGVVELKNLYTGRSLRVEGDGFAMHAVGEVLFSKVVTVNGVSVLYGAMPVGLAAESVTHIERHREKWAKEVGQEIDDRLLYMHDTDLRRYYFVLLKTVQRTSLH